MIPAFLLSPKVWAAGGFVAVSLFGCVQTKRLEQAKKDQWDQHPCGKNEECVPRKWKDITNEVRPRLAKTEGDLAACRQERADLASALATSNASIERLEREGNEATARADAALARLRHAAATANARAASIMARKYDGEPCEVVVDRTIMETVGAEP